RAAWKATKAHPAPTPTDRTASGSTNRMGIRTPKNCSTTCGPQVATRTTSPANIQMAKTWRLLLMDNDSGPNATVHPPGPLQRRGVARKQNAAPVGVQRLV